MLASVAAIAGASASAQAARVTPDIAVICSSAENFTRFDTYATQRKITHARYVSVPANSSISIINNVTRVGTVTASVTFSSSATVSASAVIGALEGKGGRGRDP